MKRLFRRIAEFFGFVKKEPKLKKETDWEEIDQKYFSKEAPLSYTNSNDFEEDGLPTEYVAERNKVVLSSREQFSKEQKSTLPKDANDIQVLDKKYNNPKTVYRNSRGRYASLKK